MYISTSATEGGAHASAPTIDFPLSQFSFQTTCSQLAYTEVISLIAQELIIESRLEIFIIRITSYGILHIYKQNLC